MGLFNAVMALAGSAGIDLVENERLARHTSMGTGGPCALLVTCQSYHALRRASEVLAREEVPWVVFGRGTNVLVADGGYPGAVIELGREFARFAAGADGRSITAGAAAMLPRLVSEAFSRSLTGLEFAVGIPGTVGGAVSLNARGDGCSVGPLVEDVVTFRPGEGLRHYAGSELPWSARGSGLPRDEIVLEATFGLASAPKADVSQRMDRALKRRRRTQPVGARTCGAVFADPPGERAASLIEGCGLQGFSVGGAAVSDVHATFIVNRGSASASDVAAVIRHVHGKVLEAYGVELQPEVKFLGF